MARGLLATDPVFRAAVEECDRILRPHLGRSINDIMAIEVSVLMFVMLNRSICALGPAVSLADSFKDLLVRVLGY